MHHVMSKTRICTSTWMWSSNLWSIYILSLLRPFNQWESPLNLLPDRKFLKLNLGDFEAKRKRLHQDNCLKVDCSTSQIVVVYSSLEPHIFHRIAPQEIFWTLADNLPTICLVPRKLQQWWWRGFKTNLAKYFPMNLNLSLYSSLK
jgi:hypothetical protein